VLALERVIGLMVRAERVVGFRDVMRKDKGAGEKAER
jgi:hypothetical protein